MTAQDISKRFITDVVALLEQLALNALDLCGHESFLGYGVRASPPTPIKICYNEGAPEQREKIFASTPQSDHRTTGECCDVRPPRLISDNSSLMEAVYGDG